MMQEKQYIAVRIGAAAALDQLAEESAELTHAALKLARIWRGVNPTPVSVADAAACCNMGRSTFSRFFSRAAGVSFPAYVRSMRLSRAVALLVGTNRSVTDIALETGFSTASYLILCFREQYHMTPAQFREVYCG